MATKKQILADLYELCEQTIQDYSLRDNSLDELEDYYFLEGDQDEEDEAEEEGIEIVHLPHIESIVSLIQDLFSGTDWSVTVPAASENTTAKSQADTAEEFLRVVFRQSERVQRQDIVGRAAWIVAMRGAIAGRVMALDKWLEVEKGEDGEEIRKIGQKVPLAIQLRDPRYVYPQFGIDGLQFVVERWKRTVQDIRSSYGDQVLPGKKLTDEVEWTEYWDHDQYCYWVDGEPVKKGKRGRTGPWPNLYRGIPYAYEFSRQTGKTEPDKRARSFLQGVRGIVDRLDRLDGQSATFDGSYIGTAWKAIGDEVDPKKIDLRHGAINPLGVGEDIAPIQAGIKPPELDRQRQKYEAMLERMTFPASLYGTDPGRAMAGYAINLLNQAGQARIKPMIECMERWLESILCNVLMVAEQYLADLIDGPIPFYQFSEAVDPTTGSRRKVREEQKFDAAKLDGFYHVDIKIGDMLPVDEQTNMVLATRARSPGVDGRPLLSEETIWERYLNVDSVDRERARIDRQLANSRPEVQALAQSLHVAEMLKDLDERLGKMGIDARDVLEVAGIPLPLELGGAGGPPAQPGTPPPGQTPPGMPGEQLPPQMQGQMMPGVMGDIEAMFGQGYPMPPGKGPVY